MLAAHLTRKDIRAIADGQGDPVPYVHRAVIVACDGAIRRAADLSRRAARLRAVAPKLRAKGAAEALALFRSHDAVSPSGMLSPMIKGTSFAMTDRAARRLCDRLVDLGAVRELTGRLTFPALWGVIMAGEDFDRELEDLPPELRWREWMGRIEAERKIWATRAQLYAS